MQDWWFQNIILVQSWLHTILLLYHDKDYTGLLEKIKKINNDYPQVFSSMLNMLEICKDIEEEKKFKFE